MPPAAPPSIIHTQNGNRKQDIVLPLRMNSIATLSLYDSRKEERDRCVFHWAICNDEHTFIRSQVFVPEMGDVQVAPDRTYCPSDLPRSTIYLSSHALSGIIIWLCVPVSPLSTRKQSYFSAMIPLCASLFSSGRSAQQLPVVDSAELFVADRL